MSSSLYISDLDGTLLDNKGNLSPYARKELNRMLESGLHFTIASARSIVSIRRILAGVKISLPVIEFNGAFISDFSTGEHLQINSISSEVSEEILLDLAAFGQLPLISCFDGEQDRLFYLQKRNPGEEWYIGHLKEKKDPRVSRADSLEQALDGEVVCFTVIDREEKLMDLTRTLEKKYSEKVEVHLIENLYSPGWYWLTVHDRRASKDQGILALTRLTGHSPEDLIVFGDNLNDLKMFALASRAVAVGNAQPQLKEKATHITGTNEEDGVVKFILDDFSPKEGGFDGEN